MDLWTTIKAAMVDLDSACQDMEEDNPTSDSLDLTRDGLRRFTRRFKSQPVVVELDDDAVRILEDTDVGAVVSPGVREIPMLPHAGLPHAYVMRSGYGSAAVRLGDGSLDFAYDSGPGLIRWMFRDFSQPILPPPLDGRKQWRLWTRLPVLMTAERTPLLVAPDVRHGPPRGWNPRKPRASWVTRRISLRPGVTRLPEEPQRREGEPVPMPKDDLALRETYVRGHWKRVACGPGRAEKRWVYVPPYTGNRWQSTRPVRIGVTA